MTRRTDHEHDEPNNEPDPRQLDLFPGFKARPSLAKCRALSEAEQLERLETVSPAPYNERCYEADHGE